MRSYYDRKLRYGPLNSSCALYAAFASSAGGKSAVGRRSPLVPLVVAVTAARARVNGGGDGRENSSPAGRSYYLCASVRPPQPARLPSTAALNYEDNIIVCCALRLGAIHN